MKGNWQTYTEQFMPTDTRNDYDTSQLRRDRDAWHARTRAAKQHDLPHMDYRAEATVTVLPDRQTLRITHLKTDENGYAAIPTRKAEIKQPTCIFCGQACSERHIAFGQTVYAHGTCIQEFARKQGRAANAPTKPVHKAIPTTPTDTDAQARDIVVKAIAEYDMVREAVAQGLARRVAEQ